MSRVDAGFVFIGFCPDIMRTLGGKGAARTLEASPRDPASAWVAGFVGYEAGAAFDPAFRFRGTSALPPAWFAVFDTPVACAHDDADTPPAAVDWASACGRERYDEEKGGDTGAYPGRRCLSGQSHNPSARPITC